MFRNSGQEEVQKVRIKRDQLNQDALRDALKTDQETPSVLVCHDQNNIPSSNYLLASPLGRKKVEGHDQTEKTLTVTINALWLTT